jgi:hypothetical protein
MSTALAVSQSVGPIKKSFWLYKYIHEADPEIKVTFASRGNFGDAQMLAPKAAFDYYKRVPLWWACLPLSFAAFELSKGLYSRIISSFEK